MNHAHWCRESTPSFPLPRALCTFPQVKESISTLSPPVTDKHAHACMHAHTQLHLALCTANQISSKSPGFTLLCILYPLRTTTTTTTSISSNADWSPPPALRRRCWASCAKGLGNVRKQAVPGAIHIPQVSLSLWMMLLPNYLGPEPQTTPKPHKKSPTHTHQIPTTTLKPQRSPLCSRAAPPNNTDTNVNPVWLTPCVCGRFPSVQRPSN